MSHEVEIKFLIQDLNQLRSRLRESSFCEVTARTHEMNTVYDTPAGDMKARGELLRLRQYGDKWTLTHKGAADLTAKHKTRKETETVIVDGIAMHEIIVSLGFTPRFRYEKYRTEYTDAEHRGHVVLDETPIGTVGEIEGAPEWIDQVARSLGIDESQYITASYSGLFLAWRERTGSTANEMTWDAIGSSVARVSQPL
jgi:adenylate cyclase class 2